MALLDVAYTPGVRDVEERHAPGALRLACLARGSRQKAGIEQRDALDAAWRDAQDLQRDATAHRMGCERKTWRRGLQHDLRHRADLALIRIERHDPR